MDPFALIDCNNFFVSCVRVHEPRLWNRPVVVLSNNDGCFISCSPEAKALGFPRGGTAFKYKDALKKHNVVVKSSNFTLFADISDRVYNTLRRFSPEIEKYSVDESFLKLPDVTHPKHIRDELYRYTRIPVTVGVGQTKTLSKAANHIAKKDASFAGALTLPEGDAANAFLQRVQVQKVWGIGGRWAAKLAQLGIDDALALKYARDSLIRQQLNVVGLRVVHELRGMRCIELEEVIPDKQQMMCCRSSDGPITSYEKLREFVAYLASTVAERLRSENQVAAGIRTYITTKQFEQRKYSKAHGVLMPEATAFTPRLVDFAIQNLKQIYRPGFRYRRAGVFLWGLNKNKFLQMDLFDAQHASKHLTLMDTLDKINARYGRDTVFVGSIGVERDWLSRAADPPKFYTTRWHDLARVG
ncbi:MAG: Y-family DNA polymerase [Bacteroidota bacterium]